MIERRLAAAHVFVEDIANPIMNDVDTHHVVRVLRVRAAETVTVSDGRGSWRTCVMTSAQVLEPTSDDIHVEVPPVRPITVAFGITKADKPETVVQKLTEIGVDHIAPVVMDHSVVRWDEDKIERQHERFRRVVREAAMQSRHVFLPTVHRVSVSVADLLRSPLVSGQPGVIAAAEPDGQSPFENVSAIVIGPEGGFSSSESAHFDTRVALPGGILRAETAAIAAGVLLAQNRVRR